jgi:hypothetical protein
MTSSELVTLSAFPICIEQWTILGRVLEVCNIKRADARILYACVCVFVCVNTSVRGNTRRSEEGDKKKKRGERKKERKGKRKEGKKKRKKGRGEKGKGTRLCLLDAGVVHVEP